MTDTTATRRTIRRYAHELYPHPDEYEIQPLDVAVPYLYARAVGLGIWGTDWFDLGWDSERREVVDHIALRVATERTMAMIDARRRALHADALLQGLGGDDAWTWAEERAQDESGETIYDRAVHYGVSVDRIKPYPVLAEVEHHVHVSEPDARGWQMSTRVEGRESGCPDCTEPITED